MESILEVVVIIVFFVLAATIVSIYIIGMAVVVKMLNKLHQWEEWGE